MTYHPHGTASGQIGHGANIDLSDTPSSTGGKFIGFGEDGTSAIANRAHWFLSENIDHVYDTVKREIAVPYAYKHTAVDQGGGGEVSLQLPTGEDVWVGDDSYPGVAGTSDLEGMMMLFSVLDDNFNELTDDSDNEIRVKMVKESTGTTDVYQDSFQDQPIIYFIAVDPVTGVTVTDPYIIPTGTAYRVAYGVQSTLEELPADALVRYKIQSSTEVQAGVILQDGTKKMTGDLDIDGNNVLNPAAIEGAAASDMLLYSKQDLNFRDQNFTTPIPFGETGQSGLYQPVSASIHPSVLGSLNSSAESREMLTGNRCVDRTGSITTSGADVTYPALRVMLQGQVVDIAGDTITGTTVTDKYRLIVTPAGVVSLVDSPTWGDDLADPIAGSVVIWEGFFTSPSTWSDTADLRWPGTRQGNHVSLYVGSGIGADCTSLDEAAAWVNEAGLGAQKASVSYEIVVVGEAELAATLTLRKGWTLRGLSRLGTAQESSSTIKTASTFDESTDVISLNNNCTVRDLTIMWDADADQDSGYVGVKLNDHCLIEGVIFTSGGAFEFDSNIGAVLQSNAHAGPVIRACYCSVFAAAGITIAGGGRVQIDNSTFSSTTAAYHIDLVPSGTTLDGTGPSHTITNCFFNGRPTEANIRVGGPNVLIDSCYGKLGSGDATSAFVSIVEGFADNTRAGITMRNCLAVGGKKLVSCVIDDAYMELSVLIEGCTCTGFSDTVFFFDCVDLAAGQITIRDCDVRGQTAGYAAYFDNSDKVNITHNSFKDGSGTVNTGIYVDNSIAVIDGNYIDSWQTGPAIRIGNKSNVTNNHVEYKGVQASVIGISLEGQQSSIEGNTLFGVSGQDYAAVGIYINDGYNSVVNNKMQYWAKYFVHIYAATDLADFRIRGNSFLTGCHMEVTVGAETDVQAAAIYFGSSTGTKSITEVIISENTFRWIDGSAIRAEDALVGRAVVSNNAFNSVEGRYLHDDGGANMEKQATIAIRNTSTLVWTISNNTFQGCGFQNVNEVLDITAHIIYLNTTGRTIISGNQFGQTIPGSGDGTSAVSDDWYDIGIWGTGDVVCSNNAFAMDITDCPYIPNGFYAQLFQYGAGDLILNGCTFLLTGDRGTEYPGNRLRCVVSTGTGAVMASGCLTRGDWVTTAAGEMWYLNGSIGGCVVGCLFDGPWDVYLLQTNGYSLGVVHRNASGATLTPGTYPSSTDYDSQPSGTSPLDDFNRQV